MKLHDDKTTFYDLVNSISRDLKIVPALIEKDYYATLLLKALNDKIPGLLFKGGTSLSKCHKIIDRFSEDIDLTLDNEHYSQSKKRGANKTIIETCDELGFSLLNRDFLEKHSHSNYNAYNIEYPILFPSDAIKPFIKVEMVFIQKAYPDEVKEANSYIGLWMNLKYKEFAERYNMSSFPIRVQSLERTLVDKVFAICDYYLRNVTERNSRHIYDIYRILPQIKLDDSLKELIKCVREDRKVSKNSVSAQDGMSINDILSEIIDKRFYEKDYYDSTSKLLFKETSYEETIMSLKTIIDSKTFI